MASRLENAARTAMGNNTDGRESMKIVDIIAKYPNGICITSIAQRMYDGRTYPVFTFAEEPSKYFSGGIALSQLVDGMIDEYDGNLAELNRDLQKEYLKIKLMKTRTKRGYNFTKAIIVGVVPATRYTDENGNTIDTETGEVISDIPF